MGQGLSGGLLLGAGASVIAMPMKLGIANHFAILGTVAGAGLSVDFLSDCTAKEGKVIVHRDVVINAQDVVRHVSSYSCPCVANTPSRLFHQKHEWLILESENNKFYTVQKNPATGDLLMDVRTSVRNANDLGLKAAGRPTMGGETRLRRADHEFDLPNDLQIAYVIAWMRKEDPRWAFSTENSKHFTTKLRYALNDF